MKKLLCVILLMLSLTQTVYGQQVNITIGFNNEATVQKPVPVTIHLTRAYQSGDILVIKNQDRQLTIQLTEALMASDQWPIKGRLFVENSQGAIEYQHYRGALCVDQKDLTVELSDLPAVGALMTLGTSKIDPTIAKTYPLSADHLTMDYLNMLDLIYMENVYTDQLSAQSVENILKWIGRGGTLMIKDEVGTSQTFTGFLADMKAQKSMSYQFGKVLVVDDVNESLGDISLHTVYPKIAINNFRGLSKNTLKLDKNHSSLIVLVMASLSIIGSVLLWLKIPKKYLMVLYGLLPIFGLILIHSIYTKPLTSVTAIHWSKGSVDKQVVCLHSLEKTKPSMDEIEAMQERSGLDTITASIQLHETRSKDELTQVSYKDIVQREPSIVVSENIKVQGNTLKGQLTWHDHQPLEKTILIAGDHIIPIGDIQQNQQVQLSYLLDDSQQLANDYERQISLVKNGQWTMDQALLFNDFQSWYQASQLFGQDRLLLMGFRHNQLKNLNGASLYIRELTLKEGGYYE